MSKTFGLVTVLSPSGRQPAGSQVRRPAAGQAGDPTPTDSKKLRYIHAPPLAEGDVVSEKLIPKLPYKDAPSFTRSVYYYWWAFLREHDGYMECCANGGSGSYETLYRYFGDLRGEDFWAWWSTRGFKLFCEKDFDVTLVNPGAEIAANDKEVLIRIPLGLDTDTAIAQVRAKLRAARTELSEKAAKQGEIEPHSTAEFPVTSKPVPAGLENALRVLRAKRAHPDASNAEIFDLAGISQIQGDNKSYAVSRLLGIARTLVDNAARGIFPFDNAKEKSATDSGSVNRTPASQAAEESEFTPYMLPPDLGDTLFLSSPWATRDTSEEEPRAQYEGERWLPARHSTRVYELEDWREKVRRTRRWKASSYVRIAPCDRYSGGVRARVLIFVAPKLEQSGFNTPLCLREGSSMLASLYTMMTLQKRVPLHWGVVLPMFVYVVEDSYKQEHRAEPLSAEELSDALNLLPDLRAIVLVGHDVQAAWEKVSPKLGPSIRIWRCDEPTAELREQDPERWAAVAGNLPGLDDLLDYPAGLASDGQ